MADHVIGRIEQLTGAATDAARAQPTQSGATLVDLVPRHSPVPSGVACVPGQSDHNWHYEKGYYRCDFCRAWRVPQPDKIMSHNWKPPQDREGEP